MTVWTLTAMKTAGGKSLYRNLRTGELRIKKMVKRGGRTHATYVRHGDTAERHSGGATSTCLRPKVPLKTVRVSVTNVTDLEAALNANSVSCEYKVVWFVAGKADNRVEIEQSLSRHSASAHNIVFVYDLRPLGPVSTSMQYLYFTFSDGFEEFCADFCIRDIKKYGTDELVCREIVNILPVMTARQLNLDLGKVKNAMMRRPNLTYKVSVSPQELATPYTFAIVDANDADDANATEFERHLQQKLCATGRVRQLFGTCWFNTVLAILFQSESILDAILAMPPVGTFTRGCVGSHERNRAGEVIKVRELTEFLARVSQQLSCISSNGATPSRTRPAAFEYNWSTVRDMIVLLCHDIFTHGRKLTASTNRADPGPGTGSEIGTNDVSVIISTFIKYMYVDPLMIRFGRLQNDPLLDVDGGHADGLVIAMLALFARDPSVVWERVMGAILGTMLMEGAPPLVSLTFHHGDRDALRLLVTDGVRYVDPSRLMTDLAMTEPEWFHAGAFLVVPRHAVAGLRCGNDAYIYNSGNDMVQTADWVGTKDTFTALAAVFVNTRHSIAPGSDVRVEVIQYEHMITRRAPNTTLIGWKRRTAALELAYVGKLDSRNVVWYPLKGPPAELYVDAIRITTGKIVDGTLLLPCTRCTRCADTVSVEFVHDSAVHTVRLSLAYFGRDAGVGFPLVVFWERPNYYKLAEQTQNLVTSVKINGHDLIDVIDFDPDPTINIEYVVL
jgi:hypothetical protein